MGVVAIFDIPLIPPPQYRASLFGLVIGLVVLVVIRYIRSPWRKVPPGPRSLPIVGNIPKLLDKEWLLEPDLKKKYGNVTYLSALGKPMIFLNSQKAATDLLDRRAHIYSDRPRLILANEIASESLHIAFARYGDRWRRMRRAAQESLTPTAVTSFHDIQTREGLLLALNMLASPNRYIDHFRRAASSVIMSILYDLPPIRSEDETYVKKINTHIERIKRFAALGVYLVEFFPWMQVIPSRFAKWKRDGEASYEHDSELFEGLVKKVQSDIENGVDRPSLSASLIKDQQRNGLSERERAWLAGIMYGAGAETTATTLEWWSLAMVAYPETQKRAQEELDAVVGRGRLPTFSDLPHLPYIRAMVKEVLRWRPSTPLGVPHRVTEDDWYEGMFIPKGTICFGNVYQCDNDPDVYGEDFMHFNPARHLDASGALSPSPVETKDEGHVVFGFGRRICVGRHVANNSLFIDIAILLWAAHFEPAKDASGKIIPLDVNMSIRPGLSSRPVPFCWTVTPRFPEVIAMLDGERELVV